MDAVQLLRIARNETLAAAESQLREALKAADASPFLGQHDVPAKAHTIIRGNLIDEDPVSVLQEMFRVCPALAVAHWAGVVQREGGKDGDGAFYPHLERELDHKLSGPERSRLHQAFRSACSGLGLPILSAEEHEGAWYRVLEYMLQAGPITSALPVLAKAAAAIERDMGLPDSFDPDGVIQWQHSLAELLQHRGRAGLARVLTEDRLAWHASTYARLSSGYVPRTGFEKRFSEAIDAARTESSSEGGHLGPPLSLRLVDDEILLLPPQSASGWKWEVTGSWTGPITLLPEEELPVSAEHQLGIAALRDPPDERASPPTRTIALWRDADLLVFEDLTGRPCRHGTAPAGPIRLAACKPFTTGSGRSAQQQISGLWTLGCTIADGERISAVFTDGRRYDILGRAEPQLTWLTESLTSLEGKPVFGSLPLELSISLSKEAAEGWGRELEVVLRTPVGIIGRSGVIFASSTTGRAVFDGLDLGHRFDRLMAALVRKGEDRPLLVAGSAWLWPGLRTADPDYFRGMIPENFSLGASRGIAVAADGLAVSFEAQRWAEVAFTRQSGQRPFRFRLRRPGLLLELEDGTIRRPLPLGSSVVDDGRPRFLRIYCDDRNAAIALPNRTVEQAFGPAGFRRVALLGLGDSGDGEIALLPNSDPTYARTLVTVTRPCTPDYAEAHRAGGRPSLEFQLHDQVGVFQLDGLDLLTGAECRLRSNEGLTIRFDHGFWSVAPDVRSAPDGAWLFDVKAIVVDSPRPRALRTRRGDHFGLVLLAEHGRPGSYADIPHWLSRGNSHDVFSRLNKALANCWEESCWQEGIGQLSELWFEIGRGLGDQAVDGATEAQTTLLKALGDAPSVDANPSWVPIRHPIELWPGLFTCSASMFASALSDAEDEGIRNFTALITEPSADAAEKHERHDEACRRFRQRLVTAAVGDMNRERLSGAATLCTTVSREVHRQGRASNLIEAPADENDQAAIVDAAPAYFSDFARAARMERFVPGSVRNWLQQVQPEQPTKRSFQQAGLLARLGPELLAWHLEDRR